MVRTLRIAVLVVAVLAVGAYFWHGVTYQPSSPWEPGLTAWMNAYLALPILAFVAVSTVFTFTSRGLFGGGLFGGLLGGDLAAALTGGNSGDFRTAPVGLGTVRAVGETGVQVNDRPMVRIDLSVEGVDGKVFPASARMVVPLTELALLRPGVVLPVRYLPNGSVRVDLSGNSAAAQQAMNESMLRKGFTTPAKLDIAARGIAAQAVVRSLDVTGEIRDGFTEVVLGLAVTRPDGSIFHTRAAKFLPPAGVANVQLGRIVQVHYLPGGEHEVVLSVPVNA